MKRLGPFVLLLGVLIPLGACAPSSTRAPDANATAAEPVAVPAAATAEEPALLREYKKIRQPAVAGLFYARDEEDLRKTVDKLLAEARPATVENVRGLVCPHAGYEFSGPVAAFGYKLLAGRDIRTVVILAPSHYAMFDGASIPDADAYQTPLGAIPVSPKAAELAKHKPFVVNPECEVRRPGFWRHSPKEPPPAGEDTPHTWEHSLEVQLPFLQCALKSGFSIVPVVFGRVDPKDVAKGLEPILDDETLVVASSDLSHYLPYDTACRLDKRCCEAVCSLDLDAIRRQEACGKAPVETLMCLAKDKGWKARLLDYRNSGDTSGNKADGVVGYAAIAFYQPGSTSSPEPAARVGKQPVAPADKEFSPAQRKYLLELARNSLESVVRSGKLPEVDAAEVPKEFLTPRACFVTLTKHGALRGCIGSILPEEPLWEAVMHMAQSAATRDPRFHPVRPDELKDVHVEISVLSVPKELRYDSPEDLLAKLRPGLDGVVLRVGSRQSTYLPQVWEQLPDKTDFMNHLAEKAGLAPDDWRQKDAAILIYQVEAFEEPEK